jgi:trimeric autotransporter adhesin
VQRTLSTVALSIALCLTLADRSATGQIYNYTINTVVGSFPYGNGGPPAQALLTFPSKIAIDSKGAVYIADTYNQMIRKISGGQISTIAGTGILGFSGDGKAAIGAQFNYPAGVAVDATGNVYVYDGGNEVIRKIDTNGIITTFAGTPGASGSKGDGGPATQAQFSLALGGNVAVDSTGNVYIADYGNHVVRKVTGSTGIISVFAGTSGVAGIGGDGSPATSATLTNPTGLAFDSQGNLYIADNGAFDVRKVSAVNGTISTVAGTPGKNGDTGNGGPATAATFYSVFDVAVDSSGNLYIVDEASCEVRKVTAGTINAFAGQFELGYSGDGGPATSALLADPLGVAVDSSGTVYIADTINNRIRTVSGGVIAEYAGASHSQGDGGKASAAVLFFPQQLAWDAQGNLYIADTDNNEVRKVAANGTISTVAGNGTFSATGDGGPALSAGLVKPQAVAVDSSGNLYIASGNQVRMVDTKGNISTIVNTAGTGGFSGDGGPATAAQLFSPEGLALDSAGNLYIADTLNYRVRKVAGGTITTVVGSGPIYPSAGSFSGDGGPATSATLSFPWDVAFDNSGNMLVVDAKNYCIRLVNAKTGNIQTIAGTPTKIGYGGDLGPATKALLANPESVAVDSSGNIYIADSSNAVVRMVDALGTISTIGGDNKLGFSGDGGPADSAQLDYPYGVAVDPSGNVWVSDVNNNRIRELTPSGPLVPSPGSVVNGASFISGGLVPGGIATVFGSRLTSATGINETSGLPLQSQFLNVSVKFNNTISAPLFAVDNVSGQQQINFQVPWELSKFVGSSVVLQVVDNGAVSPPVTVPVLAAQPGIFVALHANYQPVTSADPAIAGEVLVVYGTNLGAVSPTPADGAAGTGKQLTVAATTATVGGSNAPVSFSGLAADFVGLYQVNVQVPTGLASGNQPLVLSVSGASSKAVMIAVK